ncbi:hypothetical protein RRG08_060159 [Elysia crispata]|uniref:Uncharacterized protein n=1 Tax=Elysia crispata TaxID=231223 RepID=A0AAE1DPT8_9GAST|nr:hypothetical protein RRG08_060159 [Elysia crispata]
MKKLAKSKTEIHAIDFYVAGLLVWISILHVCGPRLESSTVRVLPQAVPTGPLLRGDHLVHATPGAVVGSRGRVERNVSPWPHFLGELVTRDDMNLAADASFNMNLFHAKQSHRQTIRPD